MPARLRQDALIALALAVLLGAIWTLRDWAALSILRLPDTDDVMRLQQVRDWLAGQAFADVSQHRLPLSPPLHWSRLADLGPAALIASLTPLTGTHIAEIVAVIAWPTVLFWLALLLIARIARQTTGGDAAPTATIIAAIAYPATTIFLPGRIDHHGLQLVLLLATVLAELGGTWRSAAAAGIMASASLVIGLETAPLLAVAASAFVADWARQQDRGRCLVALGVASGASLLIARSVFYTRGWSYPACDGFTATAWHAALFASAVPVILAIAGRSVVTFRGRLTAVAITAAGGAMVIALISPGCFHPYSGVDPMLARLWLSQVGEAQSIAAAPLSTAIGYTGVMAVGLIATAWQAARSRRREWIVLLAILLVAAAITALQLRGAYSGTMLAVPGLSALIGAARRRGSAAMAGAWLVSAGMIYPLAASAIGRPGAANTASGRGDCSSPATASALATLPPGTVMAPIDAGAWSIAATRHSVISAPYHRNNIGNLAALLFYRGKPAGAIAIADRLKIDYAVACGTAPGMDDSASAASALFDSRLKGFAPIAAATDGTMVFARKRGHDAVR